MNYRWTSQSDTNPKNPLNWTDENGEHHLPMTGDTLFIDGTDATLAPLDECDWGDVTFAGIIIRGNRKTFASGFRMGQQFAKAETVTVDAKGDTLQKRVKVDLGTGRPASKVTSWVPPEVPFSALVRGTKQNIARVKGVC